MKPNEHVGAIKNLVNGYKSTYVLITAARVGIFDVLAKSSMSARELSEVLGFEERKIEPILNVLVHYGLIEKNKNLYMLNEYKDVLDPSSPLNQLGYINHALNMADKWRNLEDTVRVDKASLDNFGSITGKDKEATKAFLQAMNTNALPQAKHIVASCEFTNHRYIDIGAGFGTYSIEIAKKFETSSGVAFDLPVAAEIIKDNVQNLGLSERISVVAGDYKKDLPKEKFDDAFLFAVIHQEPKEDARKLLQATYDILKDGGRLYLTSFFLDDSRTEPAFSVLFGVEMLVASQHGRVYSHGEVQSLLRETGFDNIECHPEVPGPATLYIATK